LLKNAKLISASENNLYNRPTTGFEIVCDIDLDQSSSLSASQGTPPGKTDQMKGRGEERRNPR